MKIAFLIRNPKEVLKVRKESNAIYLCSNNTALSSCKSYGLNAYLLDEEILRKNFREINQWGFDETQKICNFFKYDTKSNVIFQSNYNSIKYLLIQTIKTKLVLEKLVKKHDIIELHIFNKSSCLMQIICQSIKINRLKIVIDKGSAPKNSISYKSIIRDMFSCLYGLWSRLKFILYSRKQFIILSGSIQHLSLLVDKMDNIVFIENRFNFVKWKYLLKHHVKFMVIPEDNSLLNKTLADVYFEYNNVSYIKLNLSASLKTIFQFAIENGIFSLKFRVKSLYKIIGNKYLNSIVLDEDHTMRRVFMVIANQLNKHCFVISHGTPMELFPKHE